MIALIAAVPVPPVEPAVPVTAFAHDNAREKDSPFTVNVNGIDPDAAPPRVAPEATAKTREPSALDVAAVFDVTVTPDGSVPTTRVAAARVVPTHPENGTVIVVAAEALPAVVAGIV
jgi:hypothetical protein